SPQKLDAEAGNLGMAGDERVVRIEHLEASKPVHAPECGGNDSVIFRLKKPPEKWDSWQISHDHRRFNFGRQRWKRRRETLATQGATRRTQKKRGGRNSRNPIHDFA